MSNMSQFTGGALGLPPTSIINKWSGITDPDAFPPVNIGFYSPYGTGRVLLSGALTSGVYKALLSITGKGVFEYCALSQVDTTSRVLGLKLVIDGVTAYEGFVRCTVAGAGIVGIGSSTGNSMGTTQLIPFNSSFVAWVQDDHSASDKVFLNYVYTLR